MRNDLIVAVATALSPAAVSVIRLSGKGAAAAADKIFRAYSGVPVPALIPRVLTAGKIEGNAARDEALCVLFPEGRSFTGEESVEFHCHGGVALTLAVVEELKRRGARQAEAGEFTKRAFLNGKLDLTKAEGIADLIEAECEAELRAGGNLLSGGLKNFCAGQLDKLTAVLAETDAATDYPDEYDGERLRERTAAVLGEIARETETLLSSYNTGRLVKDGAQCVITGAVNTGKSSLLNALARTERAIVTDAPGTTRDLITETIVYKGFKIHLTDTAGLREAESLPERIGIERAKQAAASADIVLEVFDNSQFTMHNAQWNGHFSLSKPVTENPSKENSPTKKEKSVEKLSSGCSQKDKTELLNSQFSILTSQSPKGQDRNCELRIVNCELNNCIRVYNKCDLLTDEDKTELLNSQFSILNSIAVSAKTGENLDALLDMILEKTAATAFTGGLILTNARQRDAIARAAAALSRALTALRDSLLPLDVIYTDIKDAWTAFGAVTGTAAPETIVNALFSRFCVGK
jgi:tRNA modification GTPase